MSEKLVLLGKSPLSRRQPSFTVNNICLGHAGLFFYCSDVNLLQGNFEGQLLRTIATYTEPIQHISGASCVHKDHSTDLTVVARATSIQVFRDSIPSATLSLPDALAGSPTASAVWSDGVRAYIMIGTNNGTTFFAFHDLGSEQRSLTPTLAVNAHEMRAITALDVHRSSQSAVLHAVSGDVDGNVIIWGPEMQPMLSIPAVVSSLDTTAVVKLVCDGALVAVATGSGKIRFYVTQSGELKAEIAAHSRAITTMGYCESRQILATAAEDGVVNVWQLHCNENGQFVVRLLADVFLSNTIPVGVALSADGTYLVVSAYDSSEVQKFKLP